MNPLSSVLHLFLSTTPFLVLFVYFIISAVRRPQTLAEHYENKDELEDPLVLLSLDSILDTFLATLVLWSSLTIYVVFFVPKRRKLMETYTREGSGATQVVGDVFYDRPKGCIGRLCNRMHHTDVAYVTYPRPEDNRVVEKKIRTYHPYHREKVAIIVLPGMPLSGQPLADVERDVMAYQSEYALRSSDKIKQVAIVCFFWIIFCIVGALIIIKQMIAVNEIAQEDEEEDMEAAWFSFWIMTCAVVPLVAGLGNIIQWAIHKHWVLSGGSIVTQPTKVPPKALQPEELYDDKEGGFSLFT